MADSHGTVWAVGERECSIQRRHQKVVEEAPSPLVERIGEGMRKELFDASKAAAKAIGYTGAGTVEFLADEDGHFYFLEMNTRLQVEHPVTECTTGLDLVALQLDVADGVALDAEPPARTGHAIEVRLYAEDPAAGWQPQSGPLHTIDIPNVAAEFATIGAGIRLDSGVADGSVVGVHYDPMLAKVISVAPDPQPGGHRPRGHARPSAHPRRGHQPRPARERPAPPGVPGRRHRHRVLRHARPRRARRAARRPRRHRVVRPGRCPGPGQRGQLGADGAARAAVRVAQRPQPAAADVLRRARRRVPDHPGRADGRGPRRRRARVGRDRTWSCSTWPGCGTASRSRSTARTCTSTRRSGRCGCIAGRGSSTRPSRWRRARCSRRCRARSSASPSRPATGCAPASRSSGSRR